MTRTLVIDVGTSSVKAAVVARNRLQTVLARAPLRSRLEGDRAEVPADAVLKAIHAAVNALDAAERLRVDRVAVSSMGPSWVAVDARGRVVTPVVTHQDRRSVAEALEIERAIGRKMHLRLVGARPTPGGISSTTARWFHRHAPDVLRRAELVGHLPTLLIRRWCGRDARAIDLSHASFTGLYRTFSDDTGATGWCPALMDAAGIRLGQLPHVYDARTPAGTTDGSAATDLGIRQGTPVLPGIMDGSVPLLLAGLRRGQLVNVVGSTDVLAVCTDRPQPDERLLARAVGVPGWWAMVDTLAATGAALDWVRRVCFANLDDGAFHHAVRAAARAVERNPGNASGGVSFLPFLGGVRTSILQPAASLAGLRLSTTREDVLRAMIDGLAAFGAERLNRLRSAEPALRAEVVVSGGLDACLASAMRARWPNHKRWRFRTLPAATVLGLGML